MNGFRQRGPTVLERTESLGTSPFVLESFQPQLHDRAQRSVAMVTLDLQGTDAETRRRNHRRRSVVTEPISMSWVDVQLENGDDPMPVPVLFHCNPPSVRFRVPVSNPEVRGRQTCGWIDEWWEMCPWRPFLRYRTLSQDKWHAFRTERRGVSMPAWWV